MLLSKTAFNVIEHPAYISFRPKHTSAPVIFENPHSNTCFPDDFEIACDKIHVMRQADLHMDQIIRPILDLSLPMLEATIPRSYIDFNRAVNSVHNNHVLGSLRQINPAKNDRYAEVGLGLVRTHAYWGNNTKIRNIPPTEDEILSLTEALWHPYHDELAHMIDRNMNAFGSSYHISCHSFPMANMIEKKELGDYTFFVGTRDGETASNEAKNAVIESLTEQGFKVADNRILKGVELVARHGNPTKSRHSVQIEIVRESYMDNDTCEPHEGMTQITSAMSQLARDLISFAGLDRQTQIPKHHEALDPNYPSLSA